jgi:hypothetical protein
MMQRVLLMKATPPNPPTNRLALRCSNTVIRTLLIFGWCFLIKLINWLAGFPSSTPSSVLPCRRRPPPVPDGSRVRQVPRLKAAPLGSLLLTSQSASISLVRLVTSPHYYRNCRMLSSRRSLQRSHFPGPLKFPSIDDIDKAKELILEIHVQTLHEIAIKRCRVSPVEVLPELLRNEIEDQ